MQLLTEPGPYGRSGSPAEPSPGDSSSDGAGGCYGIHNDWPRTTSSPVTYRPKPDPLIEALGPTFTRDAGLETDATSGSLDELAKIN
jgi:hypothetical protein